MRNSYDASGWQTEFFTGSAYSLALFLQAIIVSGGVEHNLRLIMDGIQIAYDEEMPLKRITIGSVPKVSTGRIVAKLDRFHSGTSNRATFRREKSPEEPVDRELGRSRGGLTTNMVCNTNGVPLRFLLSPDQARNSKRSARL